jgi:hypothetical protein
MEPLLYYIDPNLLVPKNATTIQKQKEIHEEIRSLYLAGVPLFTKEQIYTASQQLQALDGTTGIVKILGLTGYVGEFPINTGEILTSKKGRQRIVYVWT